MHDPVYDTTESAGTAGSKKKSSGSSRMLYNVILLALLAVFLYSGYRLLGIASGYLAGRKEYASTADTYVKKAEPAASGTQTGDAASDPAAPAESAESTDPPVVPPISVDFDGLKAVNPEVVGWIYSEGTIINYPVLRAEDNDKYLHHTMNGSYNDSGSIFMDCRCRSDLSELCTILYGHHMKDGSMFASLHNYTKSEYYDQHPYMWYLSPRGDYRLDLYAGYLDDPDADVYDLFTDQAALDEFLLHADGRSNFTRKYDMESIEHVMVLSTCAYEFNDARYLVVCVPVKVR